MRKITASVLLVLYLLLLFDLTLMQFRQEGTALNLVPFAAIAHYLRIGGRAMVVNILGNLVAFLPVGLLLPAFGRRQATLARVALVSLALSLLIETLQYLSGRRTADVDDLILNTIGGLLGYGLWLIGRRLMARRVGTTPAP